MSTTITCFILFLCFTLGLATAHLVPSISSYFIFLSFFVLFYATQVKRQKIWLLFWNSLILLSDFVVNIICCLGAMKIKDSVEQMALDLFQNCDVPEEVSVTFDPEIILFALIRRENI